MSSSSDDRSRAPAVRIAGVGLGVLGAVGGIAGWFTLAAAGDGATASATQAGPSVAGSFGTTLTSGQVHTHTGGA
ncbi:MAG TPA: hypothetical protein VK903_08345 [Propionicimonas sp.]|nr:hypothetical protein [Propionicimonas sp.]